MHNYNICTLCIHKSQYKYVNVKFDLQKNIQLHKQMGKSCELTNCE